MPELKTPSPTWLDACRDFAQRAGVEEDFVDALDAFAHPNPRGGPPRPPELPCSADFEDLEASLLSTALRIEDLTEDLAEELDARQAQVFARRIRSVDRILVHFGDATGRLLRVGLRHRLRGVLSAPRPHGLRVRALADFYYSYAGRHHHHRLHRDRTSWTRALDGLDWTPVSEGIEQSILRGTFAEGPTHVNLLRLKPGMVRLDAIDCRTPPRAAMPFVDVVAHERATAAVSGGFFLYSETGIQPPERRYDPVGLLMSPGEVISPPVFGRGAVVTTHDGTWSIERISVDGMYAIVGDTQLPLRRLTTRACGAQGPDAPSISVAGRRIVEVGRRLRVPVRGFVLETPEGLVARPGDTVRYTAPLLADGRPVHTGVAGGPLLVRAGTEAIDLAAEDFWGEAPPVTFSQDETGDRNLLPRLGAGIDGQGRLLFAAVDGRNFDQALGMTLSDVARLFVGLRCHTATNLDGGSSKRMVVRGRTLDLPSTEIDVGEARGLTAVSVRPVYTALMVFDRQ